jgi:phosphoglycolate phosphatase-like HAD superfamily hydrolase
MFQSLQTATMSTATQPYSKRISIAFDFDDTLVHDSFDCLLTCCDLDPQEFRQTRIQPLLAEGWDETIARLYSLIAESQQRSSNKITKDFLAEVGKTLQPFNGVDEMFDCLRQRAQEIVPGIDVEFYLITGGILDIVRSNAVAPEFKTMWGCEFHYTDDGEINFIKRLVNNTEKTRYLYEISRDGGSSKVEDPLVSYRDLPPEDLHVPFTQMIYVGDGASDMPAFAVMNQERGMAIGVYKEGKAEDWQYASAMAPGQRVVNLAPADYHPNSELMRSLLLAVESMCKEIALRQLSVGDDT